MEDSQKQKVIAYVTSLYQQKGAFSFSRIAPATILSTDFAVFSLYMLGETALLDEFRKDIVAYLESARMSDGMFCDNNFNPKTNRGKHKNDYVLGQFTMYTLIALDMLGVHYDKLPFIEPLLDEAELHKWFEELNWSEFWYESNKIMFLFYFLAYLEKYSEPEIKNKIDGIIDASFKILEKKQDPNTGLWGTDSNNKKIVNSVFGAAHILLFYDYFNKSVSYPDRIIESCLGLHTANGLIKKPEGGACEDYDVVEIYFRLFHNTRERYHDIKEALKKMKNRIESAQSSEGGFPYKIRSLNKHFWRNGISEKPLKKYYKYSSWNYMKTPYYLPDQWSTFFRLLTLLVIEHITDSIPFRTSYHLPSWGYFG